MYFNTLNLYISLKGNFWKIEVESRWIANFFQKWLTKNVKHKDTRISFFCLNFFFGGGGYLWHVQPKKTPNPKMKALYLYVF